MAGLLRLQSETITFRTRPSNITVPEMFAATAHNAKPVVAENAMGFEEVGGALSVELEPPEGGVTSAPESLVETAVG